MKKPKKIPGFIEHHHVHAPERRQSYDHFQKVVEHAPMAMAIVSMKGVIEYINQKAIEVFGYCPADIPTMDRWWMQAYPDESYRREVIATWTGLVEQAIAAGCEIKRADYRVTCKDGTIKTVGIFGVFVVNKVFVMFDDVTERRQLEELLRRDEEQLRQAVRVAGLGFFEHDHCTGDIYWSPEMRRIYGVSPAEPITMSMVIGFVHPDDRERIAALIRQVHDPAGDGVYSTDCRIVRRDGSLRWLIRRAQTSFEGEAGARRPVRTIGAVLDITAHQQMAEELRFREQEFHALVEHAPDIIGRFDRQFRHIYINEAYDHIRGVRRELLLGKSHRELGAPHDSVTLWETMLQEVFTLKHEVCFEYASPLGLGGIHQARLVPELNAQGEVETVLGIVRDITELKHLEVALRESERRVTALLNASTETIMLLDCNGTILILNDELARRLGKPATELLGQNVFGPPLSPDLAQARKARLEQVVQSGKALRVEDEREGHVFDNNLYPLLDGEGRVTAVAVFANDITARKLAEFALQQTNEKLEAKVHERTAQLRALAADLTLAEQRERQRVAGVLHDNLQQLLIAARYHIAILRQDQKKTLQKAAAQAEDLIVQSLDCSRTLSGELSPPILHAGGLLPALEWLAKWMKDKHGLSVDLSATAEVAPSLEGVVVLLFQSTRELLLNVVKHAGVKTASVAVHHADDRISLIVTDQGRGFDPLRLLPQQDQITGLGLMRIRARLELLGGHMEIASAPGQGSRITLTAPVRWVESGPTTIPVPGLMETAPGAAPAVQTGAGSAVRKIRILVVDDHSLVRQAFVQLLSQVPDIEVVGEAADGQQAVAMARQLLPDVVSMDVSMAGMSGIEATRIIRAELPQIRVIGLSMFEESERAQAMLEAGALCYLTKSSPANALITAIRSTVQQV